MIKKVVAINSNGYVKKHGIKKKNVSDEAKYRNYFEELLNEIHSRGYKLTTDREEDNRRIIIFEKYQIIFTLIKYSTHIDFDVYCDLIKGIYEIGDLHLLTRKLLELKKIALEYNAREMNTTERLYPNNRIGKSTSTSGL